MEIFFSFLWLPFSKYSIYIFLIIYFFKYTNCTDTSKITICGHNSFTWNLLINLYLPYRFSYRICMITKCIKCLVLQSIFVAVYFQNLTHTPLFHCITKMSLTFHLFHCVYPVLFKKVSLNWIECCSHGFHFFVFWTCPFDVMCWYW